MRYILALLSSNKFWAFILFLISISEYLWTLQINLYGPIINIIWGVLNIILLNKSLL